MSNGAIMSVYVCLNACALRCRWKKHGSNLHAQVDFHTQNRKKKKTLKNKKAPRPFGCASRCKQEYAARVHATRGYHVCLRLFERPGAPTSLKKHGSCLHAQVNFHTQNQKKKTLKNTQAPRPFACASRFKQEYAAHVHAARGYHVCVRLFKGPGAPTSLKKQGSDLHA